MPELGVVEQFADPQDYAKGYLYTVSAGEEFVIPLSAGDRL